MTASIGRDLRRRREALGVSLDRIAETTAIPEDYLRALEADAVHQLPPGPYPSAFARTYRRALERLEEASSAAGTAFDAETFGGGRPSGPVPTPDGDDGGPASEPLIVTRPASPRPEPPRRGLPLAVVRALAAGSTGLFVLLIAWQGVVELQRWRSSPPTVAPSPVEVRVQLRGNARLRVRVDGRLEASRVFAGGETITWRGRERVEVEVPDLTSARVWFNDRAILPQGHQDRPRTLVFVHDARRR